MQLRSALGVGVDIEDPGHYVTITDGEGNAFLLPTPEELSELMALARAHFLKYADKELYATTKALPVTEGLAVHLNPKLWTSAREAIGLVTIAPKADGHNLMRSYAWSSKASVHEALPRGRGPSAAGPSRPKEPLRSPPNASVASSSRSQGAAREEAQDDDMEAPSDQDHAQVLRELGGGSDKENANDEGSDKENASDFVVRPIKPVLPIYQDEQGDPDGELDDDFFPQFDGAASPGLGVGETEGEDENGAELEDPPRYASPPPSQTKRKRGPGAGHRDKFAANHTDDEREPKRRVSPGPQYDEPRRHFVDHALGGFAVKVEPSHAPAPAPAPEPVRVKLEKVAPRSNWDATDEADPRPPRLKKATSSNDGRFVIHVEHNDVRKTFRVRHSYSIWKILCTACTTFGYPKPTGDDIMLCRDDQWCDNDDTLTAVGAVDGTTFQLVKLLA